MLRAILFVISYFDEPVTFRETYANTWKRLGGLLVASTIITFVLGGVGFVVFYIGLTIGMLLVLLAIAALQLIPPARGAC